MPVVTLPACPDPAHAGSRVVRDGWYGKAPHRRQRFRCYPPGDGAPHRFTPLLTHQPAPDHHCSECSSELASWQGQAGARHYRYDARSIARSLVRVSEGASYAQAGRHLRSRRLGRRLRHWERGDHLTSRWVDVFAPLAYGPDQPQEWPEVLVVDSVSFLGPPNFGSWHIFAAARGDGEHDRGTPWALTPSPRLDQQAWANFFQQMPGNPRVVVADMDSSIWAAVTQVWPQAEHYWCEFHIRRKLEHGLGALPAGDPLRTNLLEQCLYTVADWDAFVDAARYARRQRQPVGAALRFLGQRGRMIRQQIQRRQRGDARSNGAAEAMILNVKKVVPRQRAIRMGNLHRTTNLLGLVLARQRGTADELEWAARLRIYLEGQNGTMPLHQNETNDAPGQPSLRQ